MFWVGLAALRDPTLVLETVATDARGEGRPRRAHRRARAAAPARQLRAGDRSAPRARRAARGLPEPPSARDEPRAAAAAGRGRVPRAAARRAGGRGRSSASARGFAPDERSPSSAAVSTTSRSRVELAAARTAVLTPPQILRPPLAAARSPQGRPRRRTAPAHASRDDRVVATTSSADDEQQLFARLAGLRRRLHPRRRRGVVGADLDTLQSLVDKSLVRHTGGRFWMLETIREFAREQLGASERRRRDRSPARRVVPRARRGGRAVPEGSRAACLAATPGGRARQPPHESRLVLRPRRCRLRGEARGGAVAVLVHARPRHARPAAGCGERSTLPRTSRRRPAPRCSTAPATSPKSRTTARRRSPCSRRASPTRRRSEPPRRPRSPPPPSALSGRRPR